MMSKRELGAPDESAPSGVRQRFIRIGRSPRWSFEVARIRANEFRSIIEQGRDPAGDKREDSEIGPVEDLMRYIADELK